MTVRTSHGSEKSGSPIRFRARDNATTRIWGVAGLAGVVMGPDPRNFNSQVFAVMFDSQTPNADAFAARGVHVSHIELLECAAGVDEIRKEEA